MKALKLLTVALLAVGIARSYADQTNLVQNVSVQLLGVKQGNVVTLGNLVLQTVDTVSVNTRRVIQALGEATGNTFSPTSHLVLVTPLNGNDRSFQVRDGNTKVDVTAFFSHHGLSDSVHGSALNTRTGRLTQVDYSIQEFMLHDTDGTTLSVRFDVFGFGRNTNVSTRPGDNVQIDVSGSGDREGDLLILRGMINIDGHLLEVVPDDDGDPVVT